MSARASIFLGATVLSISKESAILSNVALFKELSAIQIERVAEGARKIKVAKGGVLFNKGDMPDGFFVVIQGRIKLSFISREGKEYIAEMFGSGQSFGEAVMFLDKPYPVCAQALQDTSVLHISKEVVSACIEQNSGFARKMIAGLCVRLTDRIQALEFLTVCSSMQKVIGYLLREIELTEGEHGAVDVLLSVSKATIAAQLNLTPETLSRVLHKLTDENLVSVDGKMIHVRNVQKLREFDG